MVRIFDFKSIPVIISSRKCTDVALSILFPYKIEHFLCVKYRKTTDKKRYDEQPDLSVEKADRPPSSRSQPGKEGKVSVYFKVKMNKFEHIWRARGSRSFEGRGRGWGRGVGGGAPGSDHMDPL